MTTASCLPSGPTPASPGNQPMSQLEQETYLGNIESKFSNKQGVSIIETRYTQQVSENWHSHQNAHITLFLTGGTIEKRKHKTQAVHPGSILFYHSDEIHLNTKTLFPSKNINIEFNDNFLQQHIISEDQLQACTANVDKAKLVILKIYKETIINDEFSSDSINMLLSDYATDKNFALGFSRQPQWVSSLFELLNDCWQESPSLENLSKTLNINPITISKYFPKHFGCTYGEYMRRLKISRAIDLVQQTPYSLTEIALQCGFADQSHFIRTFKEQTRFLPKEFRKL